MPEPPSFFWTPQSSIPPLPLCQPRTYSATFRNPFQDRQKLHSSAYYTQRIAYTSHVLPFTRANMTLNHRSPLLFTKPTRPAIHPTSPTHRTPPQPHPSSIESLPSMGLNKDFDDRQIQTEAEQQPYIPYEYQTENNDSWAGALPVKQGLYDPSYEKDACGVGFAW